MNIITNKVHCAYSYLLVVCEMVWGYDCKFEIVQIGFGSSLSAVQRNEHFDFIINIYSLFKDDLEIKKMQFLKLEFLLKNKVSIVIFKPDC